jgi:hypothetical protein
VAAAYLADTLQTGVGRAIVDKQHACGHTRLRQKDAETGLKCVDVVLFVVDGDYYCELIK